jgi:hypothetical protein
VEREPGESFAIFSLTAVPLCRHHLP